MCVVVPKSKNIGKSPRLQAETSLEIDTAGSIYIFRDNVSENTKNENLVRFSRDNQPIDFTIECGKRLPSSISRRFFFQCFQKNKISRDILDLSEFLDYFRPRRSYFCKVHPQRLQTSSKIRVGFEKKINSHRMYRSVFLRAITAVIAG